MSVFVKVSEQADWWTCSLFLSKLADQVRSAYPGYAEVHDMLEATTMIGGFIVDGYEPELGTLAARMLYTVARDTRDGILQPGPVLNASNEDLQADYIQSLDELLAVFEADGRYAMQLRIS